MKQFTCGEVVPGCKSVYGADHINALRSLVAARAKSDHGLNAPPPVLTYQVRRTMREYTPLS